MKYRKSQKWWMISAGIVAVAIGVSVAAVLLWQNKQNTEVVEEADEPASEAGEQEPEEQEAPEQEAEGGDTMGSVAGDVAVNNTAAQQFVAENYTLGFGNLMLINPIFTVSTGFIAARQAELVDLTATYGIVEGVAGNGRPLLDAEAAPYLAAMVADYSAAYPGHSLETRSCFRARGTQCGRLCYATGTSDHHTGLTCDLIDPAYGTELNTDLLPWHLEWQWLKENSWRYGFIDRFPEAWAGGPMSEPVNITAEGSTGLYETWHYRYVGLEAAREIAEGKYNGGEYDSLEHYLKMTGRVQNLLAK